jgi:streptogramin lyase
MSATDRRPEGITVGPDGALWFTEHLDSRIGRITLTGEITEFPLPRQGGPIGITTGPDGNIWFTDPGFVDSVGRITLSGNITQFLLPTVGSGPSAITTGPDGNLWFTESGTNAIARMTTDGIVSEFTISSSFGVPCDITVGPDGNLWFVDLMDKIGRISPSANPESTITLFPLASGSAPTGITRGSDGNLWFTENSQIGRITPQGNITNFNVTNSGTTPNNITSGPDGNLWFTEHYFGLIGRITTSGIVSLMLIPGSFLPGSSPDPTSIIAGPDNCLWFTERLGNSIARISLTGVVAEFPLPVTNMRKFLQLTATGRRLSKTPSPPSRDPFDAPLRLRGVTTTAGKAVNEVDRPNDDDK